MIDFLRQSPNLRRLLGMTNGNFSWLACNANGNWCLFFSEPEMDEEFGFWRDSEDFEYPFGYNISDAFKDLEECSLTWDKTKIELNMLPF